MQTVNLVMVNRFHGRSIWTFEDTMLALAGLLQQAGYETRITANLIVPGAINILFGVGSVFSHSYEEVRQFASPEHTIIFNGEQVESTSGLITSEYLDFLSNYVVVDWCQPNVDAILRRAPSCPGAFELPLFPAPGLAPVAPRDWIMKFDLAFYGAVVPRRRAMLDALEAEGISIKYIENVYGPNLSEHLLDCRYVLNLHAYETDLLEINRCLRPMSMGIPVISEASTLPASGDWDDSGIQFAPTEGFAPAVKRILAAPDNCLVASRKTVQFTQRNDNPLRIRAVMERAHAALATVTAA